MTLNSESPNTNSPLDPKQVEAAYEEHSVGLKRFLLGMLGDESTANDALQTTFIRLLEKGHSVQQLDSLKSWLFRVAYNEAMLVKRRGVIGRKHAEKIARRNQQQLGGAEKGTDTRLSQSVHRAIQLEDIEEVRNALLKLPESQRIVVEKRIYEGLKFREIADELDVPLGTVLARMQAGLKKLKPILQSSQEID
ncbi:MAG: RNA polymerase sigma factor [Planctomycetota bacterium]